MMMYKAKYTDYGLELFCADNDSQAMEKAKAYEKINGKIINLYEIDGNYNEVRMIYRNRKEL